MTSGSLIPGLVPGIQSLRVREVEDSSRRADARRLDCRDEPGNEGHKRMQSVRRN